MVPDLNARLKCMVYDLYVKSTDTSCHPNHVKNSIPFSIALRIRRICSTAEKFKQRTSELLEFLYKRGHKQRTYVQAQINKASQIPRRDTLYYQSKKYTDRPVCVTTYNPSLPHLNRIIRKPSKTLHSLLTDAQKTYVIF